MDINKDILKKYYFKDKLSSRQIAEKFSCSAGRVNYWLEKYGIKKRTTSEAIYVLKNPEGDPFKFIKPKTEKDWLLYGLGMGLFWGEGNKSNRNSVRLGNTDLGIIKSFIFFLKKFYKIDTKNLKFGLQLFNDSDVKKSFDFWKNALKLKDENFYKVTISSVRGSGSYKNKSDHGVLTVYFNNTKLKKIIMNDIEKLRKMY